MKSKTAGQQATPRRPPLNEEQPEGSRRGVKGVDEGVGRWVVDVGACGCVVSAAVVVWFFSVGLWGAVMKVDVSDAAGGVVDVDVVIVVVVGVVVVVVGRVFCATVSLEWQWDAVGVRWYHPEETRLLQTANWYQIHVWGVLLLQTPETHLRGLMRWTEQG